MGGITGIPAGIGLGLLARGELERHGVLPPEQAFDPDAFFEALAPHCAGSGEGELVRIVQQEMES